MMMLDPGDNASSGIKSSGDKQRDILNILDRRTTLVPQLRSSRSKIASVDLLPWDVPFSVFKPKHMQLAGRLMNILLAAEDIDEYLEILDDVRESENFGLFVFLLYSSVHNREDTRGVILPPIEEIAPHLYFTAETIHQAIQLSIHRPDEDHTVINQKTSSVADDEGSLAYFREDIGVSSHHWAWHIVYPGNGTGRTKDRKGELFYYMHNQMLARYNSERLANYMDLALPLVNFKENLTPYFAHLTSQVTGVHYSNRPPGLKMKTMASVTTQDMEIWRYRILNGIDLGYIRRDDGTKIYLQDDKGIDILGATVEASTDSINMAFYGSLHNNGHDLIASCHDPDSKYENKQAGVMGGNETAARDPIFYRWHKYIDDIFNRHKVTLPPYSRKELNLRGIQIVSAEVNSKGAELPNVLQTFMREALTDLSNAPFLNTDRKILVKYEHMDHEPFIFTFNIWNKTVEKRAVTIRVFLAPIHNVNGVAFTFPEQRRLMIEMDKFHARLAPGVNTITRQDTDSSVTLRDRNLPTRVLKAGTNGGSDNPPIDYCSCGWPQHLSIPKGRSEGMYFNLFVMATDYGEDKVSEEDDSSCKGSFSYCGSSGKKYPDSRPMGYPFDRPIVSEDGFEITDMAQMDIDNMFITDVKIIFSEGVHEMTDWTREMYQYYD